MSLIIPANSASAAGGYAVDNSCRFNGDAYVHKAVVAGNQRTFTYSFWTKRSTLNNYDTFIGYAGTAGGGGGTARGELIFVGDGDDTLRVGFNPSASSWSNYTMNTGVFRDPSAWYNIVLKVNTTSGTEAERLKIFVNGVSQGLSGYPGQNFDTGFNVNNSVYHIGRSASGTGNFIKGYLAEAVFIDGTALDADSFGEFDDSGIWKPIDVSGLTFGTNGFYLDFEDSGNLGNDANGGTDLTEVGLAATDQSIDTCTNNFATLNPLNVPATNQPTFSEGNLQSISKDAAGSFGGSSTFVVSSGKWYLECKALNATSSVGITFNQGETARTNNDGTEASYEWNYKYNGTLGHGTDSSYGDSFTTNDIVGILLNLDDNELKFSKNGTLQNSGTAISITANQEYAIYHQDDTSSGSDRSSFAFNFGSPPYAISSGNTDGNGYGNFEYAVPSGYYALNTKNLSEYG
jgi:hypothetical protein